jgi:hypothetical protein
MQRHLHAVKAARLSISHGLDNRIVIQPRTQDALALGNSQICSGTGTGMV